MRRSLPVSLVLVALIVGLIGGYAVHTVTSATLGTSAPVGGGTNVSVPGAVVQVTKLGPILLPNPVSVPSETLQDWGPQPQPIDAPPLAMIRGIEILHGAYGNVKAGIWECSVGKWRRQIQEAEFAHFVEGDVTFTPDGGQPIEIKAGDTVWFPPHTNGIWDIKTKARKTYILLGPTDYVAEARAMAVQVFKGS
jgi:uncharacterized cupin superfamily protein